MLRIQDEVDDHAYNSVLELGVEKSALQESYRRGEIAGAELLAMQLDWSKSLVMRYSVFDKFAVKAISMMTTDSCFMRRFFPWLRELAKSQARKFAILLTKVSDEAAENLFSDCPSYNIKFVEDGKFERFVNEMVPEELYKKKLLEPIVASFWEGWKDGSSLHIVWTQYRLPSVQCVRRRLRTRSKSKGMA